MDHYLFPGSVIKTEVNCFAYGGFADIWKAAWARNDSDIAEVRTLASYFRHLIIFIFNFAGRSKGPESDLDQH
jgi:hypothetical protein